MNVVHLVSNPVWGGGEKYVLDLCRGLQAYGHSVAVVTRGKSAVDRHFIDAGFIPGKLPLRGRFDFISPVVLARVLNRMAAPIVIHVHNFKDADTAVRARKLMSEPGKVRIVLTRHLVKPAKTGSYHTALYRSLDAVVFVSELALREFMSTKPSLDESKLKVVLNAVDCTKAEIPPDSKPAGEFRVMSVGRIVPEKGIDVLIEAVALLKDMDNLRVKIVGTGRGRDVMPLMQLAKRLDVSDRIEWLGHVDEVAPLMASADVGVLPSVWREPFGLVVTEFMAQGVPVIATGHGACPEIITGGVDGLLVPPSDARALADAIRSLASDEALRRRLGAAAEATVAERFSFLRLYSEIENIYKG